MKQYLDLVETVLRDGTPRNDRTGVGTISLFGAQVRYDLRDGFPLLTTKRVNFKAVTQELVWFLSGSTNTKELGNGIWDEWANSQGDLGPIYGHQWRHWGSPAEWGQFGGTDQISQVLHEIKVNPHSRRHVVSAWNVSDLPDTALPPCHVLWQLYVDDGYLDLQLYQRSADVALGLPFNIASYSLLLSMIANECGLTPRYFIHSLGDVHIYTNHVTGLSEQLKRNCKPLPKLWLTPGKPVLDMTLNDIYLTDYYPDDPIKFKVAV